MSWYIFASLVALAAVAAWRASRSQSSASSARVISASSTTTLSTFASASPPKTNTLEPLYERTVRGRIVQVTRGHAAASSSPLHGALARTRSGQWVSVTLFTPIDKLDDINDLEAPELLSGTAFDTNCGVSLFMYVHAGKDARACAVALDPSRDLNGRRETLDLATLGIDPRLFADVIDFEGQDIPMRLVRVLGVVDDLCFVMQAIMKAEVDSRLGLMSSLVKDLSIAARP